MYHFTNRNDWFKDFSKFSQLIFHSLDVTWLHSEGGKVLYVLCDERQKAQIGLIAYYVVLGFFNNILD